MVYLLSKIVGAVLTPGFVLLVVLLVGSGLLWMRRSWRSGRLLLSGAALFLLVLAVLPTDELLLAPLENRFPANPPLPHHVDGIIILGGAINQTISSARGQINLTDAAERLLEGARLARLYPEARVVFTGGASDPFNQTLREAPYAVRELEDLGVAADRLVVEDASRNTFENAVFTQRLMQPKKGQVWVLVTSASHMARAVGVFRSVNWPVIPWPVNYFTPSRPLFGSLDMLVENMRILSLALHEWGGLLFYRLSGWTDALFPEPEKAAKVGK